MNIIHGIRKAVTSRVTIDKKCQLRKNCWRQEALHSIVLLNCQQVFGRDMSWEGARILYVSNSLRNSACPGTRGS